MSLKFNEKAHRYTLDGKHVQGVTTILGAGIPKPALVKWSAKSVAEWVADNESGLEQLRSMGRAPMVEALKNVPWQVRDEAAVKGTEVHKIAEEIINGREVEVPARLLSYVNGYVDLIDAFHIEPILTEVPVANRKEWYAGKLDLVARMNGLVYLLDNKTSKGIYGETSLQTAAYARAEFYVHDNDPDTEFPMPHIDRIGVIHITETASTIHDLGDIDKAFKLFRHIKHIANNLDYLKTVVSEPLVPSNNSVVD